MGDFIDDLIDKLSAEDQKKVIDRRRDIVSDEQHLIRHGFDPDNYSPRLVLLTAYEEIINQNYYRLRENWLKKKTL